MAEHCGDFARGCSYYISPRQSCSCGCDDCKAASRHVVVHLEFLCYTAKAMVALYFFVARAFKCIMDRQ